MSAESAAGWRLTEYVCWYCAFVWYERVERRSRLQSCPDCDMRNQQPQREITIWGGYASLLTQGEVTKR